MSSYVNPRKRVHCPHCDEYLSRSAFYQHKLLYFDEATQKWLGSSAQLQAQLVNTSDLVSFEFSPSIEECGEVSQAEPLNSGPSIQTDFSYEFSDSDDNHDDNDEMQDEQDEILSGGVELVFEEIDDEIEVDENGGDANVDDKAIRVFLLFVFLWQSLFRISDSAVTSFLSFFSHFFRLLAAWLKLDRLTQFAKKIPRTLHLAKKKLNRLKDRFVRYVSCPSCHSIYEVAECKETISGEEHSRKCKFSSYPQHTQARMRAECDQILMKTMRSNQGTNYLAPFRTYCYQSIIDSLNELLNRSDNDVLCEKWRERHVDNDLLSDVYDGSMWKHFQHDSSSGLPFLAKPYNYLLMLNCDWFQPFKHTQFSVGVMYMIVENLPRPVRFKRENVLIIGVIPGPSEPSMTVNTYLKPLIKDLLALWQGVLININGKERLIRAALGCVACDVPAARKLGGFLAHNAKFGCSRCLKQFKKRFFGDYPDYSGFDKATWEPRSHAVHVWYAIQQGQSKTEDGRKEIEGMHGARYTMLYELPYYNAISSCIIDPMHCLFLGVAKRAFKVWLARKLISEEQLVEIQGKVDAFCCPLDIGRIPYKLASKGSGLKADQWKNWTMYFSCFALKNILPHQDYNCWLMFVKICSLICRRKISRHDLDKIDDQVKNFCSTFESLYGRNSLTPNLHLLGHITDCIKEHGPVYAFWLYTFERMNGILGSFPTNNHDVTVQLMRRFTMMQHATLDQWPKELRDEFATILGYTEHGSVSETTQSLKTITPLPPLAEKAFVNAELSEIESIIRTLYNEHSRIQIARLSKQAKAVAFDATIKLATKKSRYSNCSKVFVENNNLAEINFFVQCTVFVTDLVNNECTHHTHWLVNCTYYLEHQCKLWYGNPTQVWSTSLSSTNVNKYHLMNNITSRVVFVNTKVNFGRYIGEDSVLIVVPIPFYL